MEHYCQQLASPLDRTPADAGPSDDIPVDHHIEVDDDLDDATLAQLLQQTTGSLQAQMQTGEFHEIFPSVFHGLPTINIPLHFGDVVMYAVHTDFIDACPTALLWIAEGKYEKLWNDPEALAHMCRRCVLRDHPLERSAVPIHMEDHWNAITCVQKDSQDVFSLCFQQMRNYFQQFPWYIDDSFNRAILCQVYLLRLLCDLFSDGCGSRCPDASVVAKHFAKRRASPCLSIQGQEASVEMALHFGQETGQESPTSKRRRLGPNSADPIDGSSHVAPRRYLAYPPSGTRVPDAPSDWTWISDSAYDAAECGLASIEREMPQLASYLGAFSVHHPASKGTAYPSGEKGRGDLQGEAADHHGRPPVPLPDMVSPIQEADGEQGQALGWRNSREYPTAVGGDEYGEPEHSPVSCFEEDPEQSRAQRGNSLPVAADNLDADVCDVTTSVFSQHLATRGCGRETTIFEPLTSNQANRCQASPKALRICLNPEGLFCWLNSEALGLCGLGLVCGCSTDDWLCPWLYDELTRFTPKPLTLRLGTTTLHQMLCDWAQHHQMSRQHDVADFLAFCLPRLAPAFYSAQWFPLWAFQARGMQEDHHEKGERFAPLMSHVSDPNEDHTLQSLIKHWHDESGHARTLVGNPPGTCIHLDRLMGITDLVQDQRPIEISSHVALPCHIDGMPHWCGYTVVGVSYHIGGSFASGHWRTIVRQEVPWNRWLNYDDGKLPDLHMHLPAFVHQNWCVVWLASQPRVD